MNCIVLLNHPRVLYNSSSMMSALVIMNTRTLKKLNIWETVTFEFQTTGDCHKLDILLIIVEFGRKDVRD